MIPLGSIFQVNKDYYILARVGGYSFNLINIKNGERLGQNANGSMTSSPKTTEESMAKFIMDNNITSKWSKISDSLDILMKNAKKKDKVNNYEDIFNRFSIFVSEHFHNTIISGIAYHFSNDILLPEIVFEFDNHSPEGTLLQHLVIHMDRVDLQVASANSVRIRIPIDIAEGILNGTIRFIPH